ALRRRATISAAAPLRKGAETFRTSIVCPVCRAPGSPVLQRLQVPHLRRAVPAGRDDKRADLVQTALVGPPPFFHQPQALVEGFSIFHRLDQLLRVARRQEDTRCSYG